ncbi:ATP-binding protein [Sandaracinus amylolyticus]|uniref:IstB-like ATP-binding domain-containing protein n=1 Tax=Sandaracinus amylolyticus TaxID=927083 RepID=A0A0F6YJG3_9BACT|nr:ATP-binding protein [Sandaracinus amylolyticus]AKF06066.1 hypothetical protein DB32_003215 [Sandaracinus amylolyticus]
MGEPERIDWHAVLANAPAHDDDLAARARREQAQAAARERVEDLAARERRLDEASETSVPLTDGMRHRVIHGALDDVAALKWVRMWLAKRGARSLVVLCGTTGVGKTVAASDAIASTEGSRYVKAKRLVGLASAQFGEERKYFVELCRAPLLVIDEIGLEKTEAGAREALCETIDERQGRRTLVIGNLAEDEVRARLDVRTLSRIDEIGAFIDVKGEDLRARSRQRS